MTSFLIFILFMAVFPLFWIAVVKMISLFGWKHFVNDRMMRTEPPPDAEQYSGQSLTIGSGFMPSNYSNCMNGWVHHSGLYLRPMWMFQFGHPLIQFNWTDVTSIEETRFVVRKCYEMTFWKKQPKIRLFGRLGEAAKQAWEGNSRQSHHVNRGQ